MYNKFFGLKDKPFEITPDPRYLYLSESHREALAHLTYALNESKGFTVITGEVGTGKTTLVQMLLSRLDSQTRIAHLFNPKLGTRDFFKYICQDFGLKTDGFSTKGEFLALLHTFLMECYARRERVVLIVDEAQTLSPALLEEVRLLTNLETPKAKLLQVILLGQPELDNTLARSEFRQLKQRISLRFNLKPLNRQETGEYIIRRLKAAGARNTDLFDDDAVKEIYKYSKGIPRLINVVCDNSLMTGFVYEKHRIDRDIVREVVKDMEGPTVRRGWKAIFLPAIVILALAGMLIAWWGDLSFGNRPYAGESAQKVFRSKIMKALEITSLERTDKATESQNNSSPAEQATPTPATTEQKTEQASDHSVFSNRPK
ncbi:MAG: Archaeal ATPase [Syntrophaceae bacterium PtaU1.Bin231]|nr:MAG: Archaeal ATPase [Syntrophaceae bacterium PtaU1.Bin231]